MFSLFRMLTRSQRRAYFAALAGWSLDALDFFIFVFCLKAISGEFHTDVKAVAEGIFLTLAFRPLGALVFGWLAEKYGRRPILMLNVASYTVVQFATAFAPNLTTLLALRAVFGFAMGGEWGVGAALALESLPGARSWLLLRTAAGRLCDRLPAGLARVLVRVRSRRLARHVRHQRAVGAARALHPLRRRGIARLGRRRVAPHRASLRAVWTALGGYFPTFVYLVLLMACFNAFSHGSQDLYPTFLQVQHGFSTAATGTIAIVMNLGALAGGICFGALSERLGRRRAITLAAFLALPLIPLWAYSQTAVMLAVGGFLMQFMVQGAWGIVPAHLNELSPPSVRAILPGFAYQLGNLAMSKMGPFQAGIAERHGGNYGYILAWTLAVVAVALIIVTLLGPEARAAELKVEA